MDYPKSDSSVGLVNNKFSGGDAATGAAPSRITADWMNAVSDELIALARLNGGSATEGDNDQAATQVQALLQAEITARSTADTTLQKGLIPVGGIIPFPVSSLPAEFLACNGAAISRTNYSALFAVIGTSYGAGDGSATFQLPDFRGYFLRGHGGNSADIATAQNHAMQKLTGSALRTSYSSASGVFTRSNAEVGQTYWAGTNNGPFAKLTFDNSLQANTADENRPQNYAIIWAIRHGRTA